MSGVRITGSEDAPKLDRRSRQVPVSPEPAVSPSGETGRRVKQGTLRYARSPGRFVAHKTLDMKATICGMQAVEEIKESELGYWMRCELCDEGAAGRATVSLRVVKKREDAAPLEEVVRQVFAAEEVKKVLELHGWDAEVAAIG